jgi:hypothetical protein
MSVRVVFAICRMMPSSSVNLSSYSVSVSGRHVPQRVRPRVEILDVRVLLADRVAPPLLGGLPVARRLRLARRDRVGLARLVEHVVIKTDAGAEHKHGRPDEQRHEFCIHPTSHLDDPFFTPALPPARRSRDPNSGAARSGQPAWSSAPFTAGFLGLPSGYSPGLDLDPVRHAPHDLGEQLPDQRRGHLGVLRFRAHRRARRLHLQVVGVVARQIERERSHALRASRPSPRWRRRSTPRTTRRSFCWPRNSLTASSAGSPRTGPAGHPHAEPRRSENCQLVGAVYTVPVGPRNCRGTVSSSTHSSISIGSASTSETLLLRIPRPRSTARARGARCRSSRCSTPRGRSMTCGSSCPGAIALSFWMYFRDTVFFGAQFVEHLAAHQLVGTDLDPRLGLRRERRDQPAARGVDRFFASGGCRTPR